METALILTFWISVAALVYAHVGYPLLMRLIAAASRPTRMGESTELPSVTLLIPAYNEEAVLTAKLENALAIDYPRDKLEILVASDGSADRTVEIARSFARRGVRVLPFAERRGKAETMNQAVREASGDVLCLGDANVMFEPNALKRLVKRLSDSEVGAVSGDVRLASDQSDFGEGESTYYRLERGVQLGESVVGSMMGVDGGMYVIRRELFEPVPADTIIDDFVISMRVIRQGKRVVYEPSAVAHENGTPSARDEFRRRVRISAGAMQALKRGDFPRLTQLVALWQFVSHKSTRWAGPVWLVTALVASALLWPAGRIYQAALVLQGFCYLQALLAMILLPIRDTRLGGIAYYFVMSHVAMAIGLVKGLFDLEHAAWRRTAREPAVESDNATFGTSYAQVAAHRE